jgi:hypothetical protein
MFGLFRVFRAFVTWRLACNYYISSIAFFSAVERYVVIGDRALYLTI